MMLEAEFCHWQYGNVPSGQKDALAAPAAPAYRTPMPYDPERLRRSIHRIMKERNLKPKTWCKAAGVGETTLRQFLDGKIKSPTVEVLFKLAEAAGLDIVDMLELKRPPLDTSAYRAVATLLDRVRKDSVETHAALESIEDLLRSLGQEHGGSPDSPPPRRSNPRSHG